MISYEVLYTTLPSLSVRSYLFNKAYRQG